jgi:chemotaxis protein methyltransferase CheR
MTTSLSHTLLAEFSDFIANEIGLYFPQQKWQDLERGANLAAHAFEFSDVESCIKSLMSSPLSARQIEILASYLTVGETYFFREANLFQALQTDILPALIYKRLNENQRYLRIWSAGCASGEEVYSIAILLSQLLPNIDSWHITLLATDINIDSLKKLEEGVYSEWSFRGVNEVIKTAYFKKNTAGKYEILPKYKKRVTSFYHNLSRDIYPSLVNNTNAMDIIFCRNVMMYFSPNLVRTVAKHFFDCLVEGGYLIVSSSEVNQDYFSDFKMEVKNKTTFFRKTHEEIKVIHPRVSLDEMPQKTEAIHTAPDYKAQMQACADQGKLEEALAWSNKAIREHKADENLRYTRAMIFLELGNEVECIKELNCVIYLNPDFILAYMVLGNIYHQQRNGHEAKKNFEQALRLLKKRKPDEMLEGMIVSRLIEIVNSMQYME